MLLHIWEVFLTGMTWNVFSGTNIYLDTSYSLGIITDEQAKRIVANHDYRRVLFATDSPWMDQGEQIAKLKSLHFSREVEEAILGLNAKDLLSLL